MKGRYQGPRKGRFLRPGMHDLEDRIGRYIVRISDALILVLSILLVLSLYPWLVGRMPYVRSLAPTRDFITVLLFAVPAWTVALAWTGADKVLSELPNLRIVVRDLVRTQFLSATLLVAGLWFAQVLVNRGVIALHMASSLLLLGASRAVFVQWGHHRNEHRGGRRKVLVVGNRGHQLQELLRGAVNPPSLIPPPMDGEVSQLESLSRILHDSAVDRVIFTSPYTSINDARDLVELCEERGVPALFSLPEDESHERELRVVNLSGTRAFCYEQHTERSLAMALKQVIDIVGAIFLLCLLAPVFAVIIMGLLISDGFPIFFTQERIGLRGRRFRMHKLRTMVKDAEKFRGQLTGMNETGGPTFKLRADPRITPLGGLLRRSSLDELPQLLNVLAGDMSLVGPRPLPSGEQQNIHGNKRRRLAMKPGMTGLWQVSGRSDLGFEEWMSLDLDYVDRWSLWLDLKIFLKTIPAVLRGSGAR